MTLRARPYQSEDDYWRIRAFLREVFLKNQRQELSWQTARLDYWRWHVNENIFQQPLNQVFWLWENSSGEIAAVLNCEAPGDVFLQVHPRWLSADLEDEMLTQGEAHLARTEADGRKHLVIWAHQRDQMRAELLIRRGYARTGGREMQYYRTLNDPLPKAQPLPGYTLRPLGDTDEHPARSWLSWRAFHPDEPDEKYEGWDWYLNVQRAPLYRRDLDLVAVSDSGEFAAFTTIWFDDVTRTGMFEPVGVAPEHQQRGLGKAILSEGLHRLQKLGATLAVVTGSSAAATALYGRVFSPQFMLVEVWERFW